MKSLNLLTLIFLLFAFSCNKEDLTPPEGYESVIAKDFTGLDGCGILLKRSSGEILEPTNKNSFTVNLEDGKEYWIQFEKDVLHGSYCMVGDVVVLLDLKEPFNH